MADAHALTSANMGDGLMFSQCMTGVCESLHRLTTREYICFAWVADCVIPTPRHNLSGNLPPVAADLGQVYSSMGFSHHYCVSDSNRFMCTSL
jgi:hypothetical protein